MTRLHLRSVAIVLLVLFIVAVLIALASTAAMVPGAFVAVAAAGSVPGRAASGIAGSGSPHRILVYSDHGAGSAEIYAMNPDGSGEILRTSSPGTDANAVLSPDGAKLVYFVTDSSWSPASIHILRADGTRDVALTTGAAEARRTQEGPGASARPALPACARSGRGPLRPVPPRRGRG
jgi:hypothetical protein